MKDKITYDSLMRDDEFLRDAYKALQAQGINVSKQRGDILDRMLTNKRYFDTNVASTFVIGDNVKDMSDEDKQSFGRAIDKIEQLPSIGKEGAAPTSDLLKDYLNDCDYVVTCEEQTLSGGFGSIICETLADIGLQKNILRIGLPDRYIFENGDRNYLLNNNGLSIESIYNKVSEFVNE